MESGEELTLGVDTGAPYTLLDSSLGQSWGSVLESQLFGGLEGKQREDYIERQNCTSAAFDC